MKYPTPTTVISAKSKAVGGKPKRCVRGKSCSATCIDPRETCLVELPIPTQESVLKVRGLIKKLNNQPPVEIMPAEGVKKVRPKAKQELTESEKKAISQYTSSEEGLSVSYKLINECLRSPITCYNKFADAKRTQEFERITAELDSALKKLPKNTNGDAYYRGILVKNSSGLAYTLYKKLENAKPGQKFKDPAFGSYSANRSVAEDFALKNSGERNIIFINRSKKLTPIAAYSLEPGEEEALMPRGSQHTIRSVTKEGNTLIVEID